MSQTKLTLHATLKAVRIAKGAPTYVPEGLSATTELDNGPKAQNSAMQRPKKGKRGAAPRKFKLQNTHLKEVDLSRDYVKR